MLKKVILLSLIICFLISCKKNKILAQLQIETDIYFGQQVTDPYRYMENIEDTILTNWIDKKNEEEKLTLTSISNRNDFLNSLNNIKSINSVSKIRTTINGYYFYLKKDSKNGTPKLYYKRTLKGKENLLYNPKDFKPNLNKNFIINYIKPSWNASKIVVGLTEADKELSEMIIIDVVSKKVYPQIIDHCWPSELGGVSWLQDNTGFIYVHLPITDNNSKEFLLNTSSVLYKIGKTSKNSQTLFSAKNYPSLQIKEEDYCETYIQDSSSKYLISEVTGASQFADCYYSEMENIQSKKIKWKSLFYIKDEITNFYLEKDSIIYLTSKKAPNFKICKTSILNPDFENPIVLVPEDSKSPITDMTLTKKGLYFVKTTNGVDANLFKLDENKKIKKVKLPKAAGYINVFSKGSEYDNLWASMKGWVNNTERYKYNFSEARFVKESIIKPTTNKNSIEDVIIEEIEIPSHDGIMVPLSIIYKKGVKKDKKNRLLINAYGSYGWSNSPYPYSYLLHWIEKGGVYAVAHVRGGGEKGEEWRKGGYKVTKPNTWKDLIACTEYLVENKYTSPERIAAWGASAGGICVGRAITERPDLFAAAIIKVGLLNTLRAETGANGPNNVKEFGTVKDSLEFISLLKMDAYHSIKDNVKYPAVYLTAGLNDARLPVWHTTKFAARLENATNSDNPVLVSIDSEKGHGLNASQAKKNEELANILSFALWQTGHPDYQLEK